MKINKYLNLQEFQKNFDRFLEIPRWTKQKHKEKSLFIDFLNRYEVTTISVKPNSKYNYCSITHSFTIFKVPSDKLGKLFKYRNKWVLIRCGSDCFGSWGFYWNEIYELKDPISQEELNFLKEKYEYYFISND